MTEELRFIEIMSQLNHTSDSTPSGPLGHVDPHVDGVHGDTTTTHNSSTTDTNTVRAIIDQAELDKLSKFSNDAWKIANDPYYEVLNSSNELIADEIINKFDNGQSGEALQIFRDWKHQFLDAMIVEKRSEMSDSNSGIEDYSDDFEGLVDTYQNDCEEIEQGLEESINSSEESEDEDLGIVISSIPAGQTTFSPAQFQAIVSGEFYDSKDITVGAQTISDEEQQRYTGHVVDAIDEALPGVITAESSRFSSNPEPDRVITLYCGIDSASIDADKSRLFDDDNATAGAIDPGRRNPFTPLRPRIVITCFDLEEGTKNELPFMKTTISHNAWCECIPCTLRKMKTNKRMTEPFEYYPVKDVRVGSLAPGLPVVVIDNFDQARRLIEACMRTYGIKPISRANYIRDQLQHRKYPRSNNRISEVEESDDTSCSTIFIDDNDCTSGSKESDSKSTVDTEYFGDDHSCSRRGSVAEQAIEMMSLVKQVSSPDVPQNAEIRSSDEVSSYFDRIIAFTYVSLLLVMFAPKWLLAGALAGLLLSKM